MTGRETYRLEGSGGCGYEIRIAAIVELFEHK